MEDPHWPVRYNVAAHPAVPEDLLIRLMADPVSPFARFARFRAASADSARLQLASRLASSDRFAFSADALLAVVADLLAPHVPAVFGV